MADPQPGPGARGFVLRAAAWTRATPRRERLVQLGAAALSFEGFALMLVAPKVVIQHPVFFWVGAVFLAAGLFVFLLPSLERTLGGGALARAPARERKARPAPSWTLADGILARLTRNGRFDMAMPILGGAVIAFDLLYNGYLTPTPKLLSTDWAILGFGASLVAFPFVPHEFARERNFLVFFFGALSLVFGVPLLALRLGHDATGSVDEYTAKLVTA